MKRLTIKDQSSFTIFMLVFLAIMYAMVFYSIFTGKALTDYPPFYRSSLALGNGNPYTMTQKIATNLNPPVFMLIIKPLTFFSYFPSLFLWMAISLTLGFIAAKIAFRIIFSEEFLQKNWINLYLIYFSFYPTLMDISIAQIGQIMFFFLIIGYDFYLKKKDRMAGLFWGIIISIKFFPALLFFYVYKQQRMEVFKVMLLTFFVCCLIPFLIYGSGIYFNYFTMVSKILWYGDSWNASLYGFLFRQLINTRIQIYHDLMPVEVLFLCLFIILLIAFYLGLGPKGKDRINHQPFCLTLAMMLFLSPFGWLYYFPLLILPLFLTFFTAFSEKKSGMYIPYIWVFCFFLLDFPQTYILSSKMFTPLHRLGLFSFHFYGLLLLILFLFYWQKINGNNRFYFKEIMNHEQKRHSFFIMIIIAAYGLTVPLNSYFSHGKVPIAKSGVSKYRLKT